MEEDFAYYEGMVTVLARSELSSPASLYNEVRELVEGTNDHVTSAMQTVEAEDRSRVASSTNIPP